MWEARNLIRAFTYLLIWFYPGLENEAFWLNLTVLPGSGSQSCTSWSDCAAHIAWSYSPSGNFFPFNEEPFLNAVPVSVSAGNGLCAEIDVDPYSIKAVQCSSSMRYMCQYLCEPGELMLKLG